MKKLLVLVPMLLFSMMLWSQDINQEQEDDVQESVDTQNKDQEQNLERKETGEASEKKEKNEVPEAKESQERSEAEEKTESDEREERSEVDEEDVQPRIIYYPNTQPRYYRSRSSRQSDIKTLSGNMHHSGGFWGASFRTTQFRNKTTVMAGMRAGWIINRTLGIGIEGHGIIPTAKFDDISDQGRVVILGGYGGMFMEFILFSNQLVHVTFPISAGAGWLGYANDWEDDFDPDFQSPPGQSTGYDGEVVDDDVFWYVEPGVDIEMNISRNFRMAFGVSKRFSQDLVLVNTSDKAFDKLNYFVTLKVGKF